MILEQVRREALIQPLESVEAPYGYDTSPVHTPPCFEAVRDVPYNSSTKEITYLSPIRETPYPSPNRDVSYPSPNRDLPYPSPTYAQLQPAVSPPPLSGTIKTIDIKMEAKIEIPQKRRSSSDDNNGKWISLVITLL